MITAASTWKRRRMLKAIGAGLVSLAAGRSSAEMPFREVQDLDALAWTDPRARAVHLIDIARAGVFQWRVGDFSAKVARDVFGGRYIASHIVPPRSGAWVRQGDVLTPEMFGARPDQADHTSHIEALFNHVDKGVHIELNGRYILSRGITIARKSGFRIGGTGELVMRAGTPVAYDYWLLYLVECADFELASVTFDANRAGRAPREVPAHTILFQSCQRFRCTGVRSINAVCDGFILLSATPERIDTHCRDFQFIDCSADNCFRQGCSVIQGHDGLFRGGSYSNTNGTAPSAGIDLECDEGAPPGSISEIVFENVRFAGNQGYGLLVSTISRPKDIVTTDCVFEDNGAGAISWGATRGRIARAKISGFGDGAVRGAIDVPAGDGWHSDGNTTIERPSFSRVTTARPDNQLVYVHAAAYGPVLITGMEADACGGIAGLNRDGSSLIGATVRASLGKADGAVSVSGRNCTVAENRIDQYFGSVIIVTGEGAIVRSNMLLASRFNNGNGAIRILAGGAVIERNIIESRDGTTGIRLTRSPLTIQDNRIAGFAHGIVNNPE